MARAYLPSLTFFPVSFSTPVIHTPTLRCSFATSRSNRPHSIHSVVSVASTEPRFYVDIAPPFFASASATFAPTWIVTFPVSRSPEVSLRPRLLFPTNASVSASLTLRPIVHFASIIRIFLLFFFIFYFGFLMLDFCMIQGSYKLSCVIVVFVDACGI